MPIDREHRPRPAPPRRGSGAAAARGGAGSAQAGPAAAIRPKSTAPRSKPPADASAVAGASAAANAPAASATRDSWKARIGRYPDLVVLAVGLPLFVAGHLPLAGYAAVAGIWIVQRAIQVVLQRRADASAEPRAVIAANLGGAIGRGIFTAVGVFVIGTVLDNRAGLAAALLAMVVFTAYFVAKVVQRGLGPA